MQNGNVQNVKEPDFRKKIFSAQNAGNMPEIAVFADLVGFFPHISLFFHTKTLLIIIPTIKLFFNCQKADFWSRKFLKIARTAHFCRKTAISLIYRAVLDIFSWNFAHSRKMVMSKMWRSPTYFLEICRVRFSRTNITIFYLSVLIDIYIETNLKLFTLKLTFCFYVDFISFVL